MFGFIMMSLLGFLTGGGIGHAFFSGFYPAAWIGLVVGIALWGLFKMGASGAMDGLADAFDGFGD